MTRTVVLAGASGYGATYVREIAELEGQGRVRLVGLCDLQPLDTDTYKQFGDRPFDTRLDRLLAETRPDLAIVATPIHTHLPLSRQVLNAGSHLLLEKPPAPSAAEWREILTLARHKSLSCQVGFQSLGSGAYTRLAELMAAGELGAIRGIGCYGAWSRDAAYYQRATWAGRRELNGVPVADGALTNPFAHAVATALALDGSTGWDDIAGLEAELLRVRDIQVDDTSCLRLRTGRNTVITIAVTLAAETPSEPVIVVHGTQRRAELHYTRDLLVLDGQPEHHGRTSPLENFLANLGDGVPLQCDIAACGAFTRVLEHINSTPTPRLISERWLTHDGGGPGAKTHIPGVEQAVRASAEQLSTFTELAEPWAV
ncbi:Gfo/Idh/MocA family protein [Streptomyces sp. NBC_00059]|uniref:Gfo/Idh/MocA family protein n=1 Tax=Streptomyces sp. NBC_00059 TaxID=2975635 RepID=UPI00224CE800|nr:Gfo/Idh/MocA family oxidoreductase [Streptomyces sp. NBC_00059]MCX5415962.1 Gfo/Idh/MocA family oxidoreductase [Streptomyces sp. NBC_00059]